MSNLQLFVIGVLVTIPASITIGVLVFAAIADGREIEQMKAQQSIETPKIAAKHA